MIHTVEEALSAIDSGQLVVVQTDTVLGIIADGTNTVAVERLYALKKRDKSKSFVVFVKSQESLMRYVKYIPDYAQQFMQAFWPGALTLIFQAKKLSENHAYLANEKNIALRMPNEEHLLALLERTSKTIISTSANISGQKPYHSLEQAESEFGEHAVYWEYEEELPLVEGKASTVIDCQAADTWQILREGSIAKELLWEVLDEV